MCLSYISHCVALPLQGYAVPRALPPQTLTPLNLQQAEQLASFCILVTVPIFIFEFLDVAGEAEAPKRPHPRHGHCAVALGDSMYIFGGQGDEVSPSNDPETAAASHWGELLWRLDLQSWKWHRLKPKVCHNGPLSHDPIPLPAA
jgi:hypothetical protein